MKARRRQTRHFFFFLTNTTSVRTKSKTHANITKLINSANTVKINSVSDHFYNVRERSKKLSHLGFVRGVLYDSWMCWKLVQIIGFNLWEQNVEIRLNWIQGLIFSEWLNWSLWTFETGLERDDSRIIAIQSERPGWECCCWRDNYHFLNKFVL